MFCRPDPEIGSEISKTGRVWASKDQVWAATVLQLPLPSHSLHWSGVAHLESSVLHVGTVLSVFTDTVSSDWGLSMLGRAVQSCTGDSGTKSGEDKSLMSPEGVKGEAGEGAKSISIANKPCERRVQTQSDRQGCGRHSSWHSHLADTQRCEGGHGRNPEPQPLEPRCWCDHLYVRRYLLCQSGNLRCAWLWACSAQGRGWSPVWGVQVGSGRTLASHDGRTEMCPWSLGDF